jgi:ubiquinone/menaquinone biosynthesis C-methylase UbiE
VIRHKACRGLTLFSLFSRSIGKEYALGIPDKSVDMIVIGSAAHWFDWSSEEATERIWKEWTRVLRKDGTLFALG